MSVELSVCSLNRATLRRVWARFRLV